MILIRADANEKIGSGHVMRCLSIARSITHKGQYVKFVTADNKGLMLISSYGFDCEVLDSNYDNLETEIDKLTEIINNEKPSLLLVDSYFVSNRYFNEINKIVRIAYIDDLNESTWNVDFIINYNISSSEYDYSGYEGTNTRLLLSPYYAPLRDEFRNLPVHLIKPEVSDVFVSAGGSDPACISEQIMTYICPSIPNVNFHFIIGALNPRIEEIRKLAHRNVILHIDEQHIADVMKCCDIAISASGSTLYELCSVGVPTIIFTLADNQIPAAKIFDRLGIMLNAGDCRFDKDFITKLYTLIRKLLDDIHLKQRMSINMQQLVDGKGASRIAEQLLISK